MEQLKVALFPNMSQETDLEVERGNDEVDEAESLAEKLIHDLMRKPPAEDE